ncbi:MAG: hypothetical protein LBC98_00230 [Prevotellaceae bacterium]|jgi:hypothetical protein|nr:hypothetical protein [Prevotellaceae bacterium]
MALKITFFKTPKPKQFFYIPRVWNPEKEDRENRIRAIEKEMGIKRPDETPYRPDIRGRFSEMYERDKKMKKNLYGDRLRMIIILGTIMLIFIAMFFFAKMFPMLFSWQDAV